MKKENKRFFWQGLVFKIALILVAGLLMVLNFSINCFNGGKNASIGGTSFDKFQEDSEQLVINRVYCDESCVDESGYGLNWNFQPQGSGLTCDPYQQQVGAQGYLACFLHNTLNMSYTMIKLIYVTLLAAVLILICMELSKKFGKLFGFISYIVFLFSPWICAFARNLYWVEFTWFLPMLFGLKLVNNYDKWKIYTPLIFLSVFIKCLCGYEYLTVIMLSIIIFMLYDFVFAKGKQERIDIFKKCVIAGCSALLGFVVAIMIHAGMRGDGNLFEGFKLIYTEDVQRRTLMGSDAEQFGSAYTASLKASPIAVLFKYFSFRNSYILGTCWILSFELLLFMTILFLTLEILISGKKVLKKWVLFVLLLLSNASWFVLASPHSYIHMHMNYVLWYFGFLQFELYVIISFILKPIRMAFNSAKATDKDEIPNHEKIEISKKKNKYCLLIPVINEGERIIKELETAKKFNIHKQVDIIICDGDSTDGSITEKAMKDLGVNTILIKKDTGKQGAQLRMGINFAFERDYDGIITIDGNNKDSIEDVPKFIEKLDEGYDLVQGSRFVKGGEAINTPFIRHVSVRLLHAPIISLTAGEHFTDTTNAYRAYSKKYLTDPRVQPLRGVFQTYELLAYLSVRASQLDMKTCEIPVRREYPKKQKTPTKISFFKGNYGLFKILILNAFGKYKPKEETDEEI